MYMLLSLNLLMSTISLLISVAFYTILERKILSYMQMRKGPNKVGLMGLLQPFSDALKLFNKKLLSLEMMNFSLSYISPATILILNIMIIPLIPFFNYSLFDNKHSILLFFVLSTLSVYFILMIGWSTNSKYCFMGVIRSVAQMISYEITFFLILLFIIILSSSFLFTKIEENQNMLYFFWGNMILFFMWIISCLAETNRSPFDFAEGESELVSGFNIEYMGGWFALIFLSEYLSMIILSMISIIMFFCNIINIIPMLILLLITTLLIWIRGTYPRFRYDMLMILTWKIFLPSCLLIIFTSMLSSFYFY